MLKFAYRAISQDGSPVTGVLEAETLESAQNALFARGYIPSKVSQKGGASLLESPLAGLISPIRTREIIIFTKQLSTMIRAGVPILRMFEILGQQTENRRLKHTIEAISGTVKEGASMYSAFNRHPKVFSELYCSMLQAGEESGSLPEVLDRLTYIIEHEEKVKAEIKSALTYPAIVFVFLVGAFFFLLGFVVPRFVSLFQRARLELPWPTKITMVLHHVLINYWYLLLGGFILLVIAVVLYLRTEKGKYHRDLLLMNIPLIGPLLIKAAMSRFASIFAIFQSSGIAVLDTMRILSRTIGNHVLAPEFSQIEEKLREGKGIAAPLASAKYFPPMVVNMVAIGEESGNLDEMLRQVSKHYDSEVEYATYRLTTAINPVMTIGLAAVVGFFAVSILMPMFDLTKLAHTGR